MSGNMMIPAFETELKKVQVSTNQNNKIMCLKL